MKFSKMALLPLLALALVACTPSTSSKVDSEPTHEQTESTPTPSNPSTSTPAGSEEETTTSLPPAATDWTEQEKTLMKEHLNGNVLPYVPVEGAAWKSIDLEAGDPPYLTYFKVNATMDDINGYCERLLAIEGYADLTEIIGGNETQRLLIAPLANVDWHECAYINVMFDAKEKLFLALYEYDIDVREWDADFVNANIEVLYGVPVPLPAPAFPFEDVDIYLNDAGTLIIDLYTETSQVASYTATLEAAGWVKLSEGLYQDSTGALLASVTWYEDYGCTTIEVSPKPAEQPAA